MRGSVKVAPVTKKRRDEGHVLRRMLDAPEPGKRRRERLKTRGKDSVCKRDMESVGKEEDISNGQHTVDE